VCSLIVDGAHSGRAKDAWECQPAFGVVSKKWIRF
jgi:hypothetical protein